MTVLEPEWDISNPYCWTWHGWQLTRETGPLGKQRWRLWRDNRRQQTFADPEMALRFAVAAEEAGKDAYLQD